MIHKIMNKMLTLFTAAFGVIAALAWDDAVKSLFKRYYPFPGTGIEAKFTYALGVTIIAVIVTTIFAGMMSKEEKK
jgi:hypothetical protein